MRALWNLGFRPFFLLGSASGVISLAVWLFSYSGAIKEAQFHSLWHAHEMIHGFVMAIVVGFLLTASANWAGMRGLGGGRLAALCSVWVLARLTFLVPESGALLRAAVDLSFLPFATILLFPYLRGAKNRANLAFVFILLILWACNVVFHLEASGIVAGFGRKSLLAAVQLIAFILIIISGRVIPFFSERAIPDYKRKTIPRLDILVIITTMACIGAYLFSEIWIVTSICAAAAGAMHALRLALWYDRGIWGKPILHPQD